MKIEIDHASAEFPFAQLARIIREAIQSGEYPPGRKLPPITEITSQTGLSPMTIRRAFAVLAEEKLVTVVPGRGTFVARA